MDELKVGSLLKDIREVLIFTLKRIGITNSNLARETIIRFDDDGLTIIMPDYAINIDQGRRKGSMPPIKAMIEFINDRGISPRGVTKRQLAFAIANSIKRDGIRPRPFIERFNKEVNELILIHINNELLRITDKILN